jgi:hypothetical protein
MRRSLATTWTPAATWTPFHSLALSVLVNAVLEAHAGQAGAREFLADEAALGHWCELLGLAPARIRRAAADPTWPARYATARAALLDPQRRKQATERLEGGNHGPIFRP